MNIFPNHGSVRLSSSLPRVWSKYCSQLVVIFYANRVVSVAVNREAVGFYTELRG